MSAGLMSCVRENSPPLETGNMEEISTANKPVTPGPEFQKRRRFHPLRNLRRIFRRRTVTQTDAISPSSSIDDNIGERIHSPLSVHLSAESYVTESSATPTTTTGFLVYKQKRERSADGARTKEVFKDIDRDMADYHRSLSEGKLVDSEFTHGLSQSHDSVFSESATGSSLSIVLKAELTDVLKKRRNKPNTSDEDLGLPRSPTTPQRKGATINQSQGSLSILSTTSFDCDEDSFTGDSSTSQNYSHTSNKSMATSSHTSKSFDEVDLDMSVSSVGSSLSHAAAKHKMAIRPKKKGPSRYRSPHAENYILPSTPEVNEETMKQSTLEVDGNAEKHKLQVLPMGIGLKQPDAQSPLKTSNISSKEIHDNIKTKSSENIKMEPIDQFLKNDETIEQEGVLKRLLKNKMKKLDMDENVEKIQNELKCEMKIEVIKPALIQHSSSSIIDLHHPKMIVEPKPYESMSSYYNTYLPSELPESSKLVLKTDKPKSGAASRQRVLPQDISILPNADNLFVNPSTNNNFSMQSEKFAQQSECSFQQPHDFQENASNDYKIEQNDTIEETNDDYSSTESQFDDIMPPLSSIIAKIERSEIRSGRHKPVEKAKSFRVYTDNVPEKLGNISNMPSLPDLSGKYERPKFLSAKPDLGRSFREVSKFNELRFEINDNKLIKPKPENARPPELMPMKKNICVTSPKPLNRIMKIGPQNISQIEDNIDRIMKSSLTTVLKKSLTTDNFEIKSKNNISITPINSKSYNEDLKNEINPTWIQKDFEPTYWITSPPVNQAGPVPEFLKIQLNRIEMLRPKSHVIYTKNSNDLEIKKRRFSNESVEITDYKPGSAASPVSTVAANHFVKLKEKMESMKSSKSNCCPSISMLDISQSKFENEKYTRRKSTSDEKIKFEKKLEEKQNETLPEESLDSRKNSLLDENTVVLRKKSFAQHNSNKYNQEDTPELMKVFARRSLKLKDSEELQIFDNQKSQYLDSDKENQSSSEEKLNKFQKIDSHSLQRNSTTTSLSGTSKTEDKLRKSSEHTNSLELRKNFIITPKPFLTPNKITASHRNTTSAFVLETNKNILASSTASSDTLTSEQNTENNNNTNNNNIVRHTIANAMVDILKSERSDESACLEFKGILQRRAEWEKRAKEALK